MMNVKDIYIHGIGQITEESGFFEKAVCSDGHFAKGKDGVNNIVSTKDQKVELISFEERTLAYVKSNMGYPAYYPITSVELKKPIQAILMDLDGTTVRSEEFWIWIIEKTVQSLLDKPKFSLEDADIPYVSGHSVSEHLTYCIQKYCPEKQVEDARKYYFIHTNQEMQAIMKGTGRNNAFTPTKGIKEFLYEVKSKNIKIGLVTSGLYEKAYPEILSAFHTLGMGEPTDFYDAIITAGQPLLKGRTGTLGELEAKPHPWLYAETCRVGLSIHASENEHVIGIEDSGAGVCAVRLAGFYTVGIAGGNIITSGTRGMCHEYCETFDEITAIL
ncbi:HAD family phosphatase [Lachnospiraceae bacterium ZAX-1]